jgi:hypothetical protein
MIQRDEKNFITLTFIIPETFMVDASSPDSRLGTRRRISTNHGHTNPACR